MASKRDMLQETQISGLTLVSIMRSSTVSICLVTFVVMLCGCSDHFHTDLFTGWAKSGERKALYRVTQLLELMEELGLKGGDSNVQPNSRTYCAVLDTLARSKNFKAYNKSLEILQRMEGKG